MNLHWKILLFIVGLLTAVVNGENDQKINVEVGKVEMNFSTKVELVPENTEYLQSIPYEGVETLNSTLNETSSNTTQKVISCKEGIGGEPVKLVNGTELMKILVTDGNITSKDIPAECVLILFYAKYCTFSSMAAPHFNALARAFPDIKLAAIDAMKYHVFNTQNGIVGVPTLILFHNGRPISKFNDTEYTLELFSRYLTKYTGIKPVEKSYVTSTDFGGPVSSNPEKDTDYFLGLSWIFIIICGIYYFTKSQWWQWIVETVQNTWRDSEAQHEHNE